MRSRLVLLLVCLWGCKAPSFDGSMTGGATPTPSGGILPGSGGEQSGGALTGGGASGGNRDGGEVLTGGSSSPRPEPAAGQWSAIDNAPDDEAAAIYDPSQLRTFSVEVAPSDLAKLDADPAAEEYVPAMLNFEGMTYGPIGIRYKGSLGSFLPPCTSQNLVGIPSLPQRIGKCSVKISFNKYDPEGEFFGLRKLQFLSMNNDPSMLRDRLTYAMFREQGVPAPRAVHANLVINGQPQGLFSLVEVIDGRFTRSRFSEGGKGNLYKEVWPMFDDPQTYLNALETNEDENPSAQALVDLAARLDRGEQELEGHINWEEILRFIAADRVLINDDGPIHFYCNSKGQGNNPGGVGNHNYFWYEEEREPHLWLIPWDMDLSLTRGQVVNLPYDWRYEGNACICLGALLPPMCDPFFRAIKARNTAFESAVDDFLAGPFRKPHVDALLAEWETQIGPAVTAGAGIGGAPTYMEWQSAVTSLRAIIDSARTHRGAAY